MNLNQEISKSFNRAARSYINAAKIQQEIANRLLERLDYIDIKPQSILDLGSGPGRESFYLKKRYPKATVVSLDLALNMLKQAYRQQTWRYKWSQVNADMHALPFKDNQFDLIIANQTLHWSNNLGQVLKEMYRVTTVQGCLLFSTLGPDTFKELIQAFETADDYDHVNVFIDMHNIGDLFHHNGYQDTVMDREIITVRFKALKDLLASLKSQGVRNIHAGRNSGLTGKKIWQVFSQEYARQTVDDYYPLTYEVTYGLAWKKDIIEKKPTESFIPISHIKKLPSDKQ